MASIRVIAGEPALLIISDSGEKTLVAADIHIGIEAAVGVEGVARSMIKKTMDKIARLAKENKVDRVVLIGDIRHRIPKEVEYWQHVTAEEEMERRLAMEVPDYLLALQKESGAKLIILPGNHDGALRNYVESREDLIIENIGIFHGHRWPEKNMVKCDYVIAAHSHPAIVFRDALGYRSARKAWVIGKVGEGVVKEYPDANIGMKVIIMPAFNDFIVGTDVKQSDGLLGPLFKKDMFKMEDVEIYTLDGIALGSAGSLQQNETKETKRKRKGKFDLSSLLR